MGKLINTLYAAIEILLADNPRDPELLRWQAELEEMSCFPE